MLKFPWKTVLAGAAVLAGTVYVVAAQLSPGASGTMHGPMMHGGQGAMPGGMHDHMHGNRLDGMPGGVNARPSPMPALPGQDAFGAIQEIVNILEADPATDWSKVNIDALREHLIDMNEVTLNAKAALRMRDDGIVIEVSGEGRTLAAIKRMVPAHVRELLGLGWQASTEDHAGGVTLTVKSKDARERTRLKALGFIGIMAQGAHHQPHHLMMAKGEFAH